MRLFIVGANGRTGTELIDLSLARGHHVTAFVRSANKITRSHPRLQIVVGDPKDVNALAGALPGHDAVFSALGIRGREIFQRVTLLQECAATMVAAMTRASVRRLVLVSAATLFAVQDWRHALARRILKNQIRDLVVTEQIIRATDLDWTIARPPKLNAGPGELYRAETDRLPDGAWSMSFRGVARFLLDAVEQQTHVRQIVGLGA